MSFKDANFYFEVDLVGVLMRQNHFRFTGDSVWWRETKRMIQAVFIEAFRFMEAQQNYLASVKYIYA